MNWYFCTLLFERWKPNFKSDTDLTLTLSHLWQDNGSITYSQMTVSTETFNRLLYCIDLWQFSMIRKSPDCTYTIQNVYQNIAISRIKIAVSQHHKNPSRNSLHVNKKYLYVLQYTHTCVTSGAGRFSSNLDRAHWVMSAVVLPPSYSSASFLVPWAKYLIVGYPLTPYLEAKPWCTVASTAPSFTWNVIENWGKQLMLYD